MTYDRYLLGGGFAGSLPPVDRYLLGGVGTTPAETPYSTTAVDYDGSTTYATRGATLSGVSDGKQGTLSFWVRLDGATTAFPVLLANATTLAGGSARFACYFTSVGALEVAGLNAAGTAVMQLTSTTTYSAASTWRHILVSWDLTSTSKRHMYIDGVSVLNAQIYTNDAIDYAVADWSIGALANGTQKLSACLSEVFFHAAYLDLSDEANRRLFSDDDGFPRSLGTDGSTPFGTPPAIYLASGDPADQAGAGGAFSVNGTIVTCSTTPSASISPTFTTITPNMLSDNGYSEQIGGTTGYVTSSSDYDGSANYATRGANLTGVSDGKQGLVSFWLRLDGATAGQPVIFGNATTVAGGTSRFAVLLTAAGKIEIGGVNAAGVGIMQLTSVTAYSSAPTWLHVIASWDLADSAKRHMYISDVSVLNPQVFTNDTIDYAGADWSIGALPNGTQKLSGCLSEVFFHPTYLDLSVEANRRLFFSASGKPVSLGASGSNPLGAQPVLYVAGGNPVVQAGSGGAFTVVGSLPTGSSSPSDGTAEDTSYYLSSAFARLVVSTDATAASVRWYANPTTYGQRPAFSGVGVWDGTTKQFIASGSGGINEGTVSLASGTKTVEILAGGTNRIDGAGTVEGNYLIAVALTGGSFVTQTPGATTNRLVIYGDSIAIGSAASSPTSNGWAMKLRALRAPSSTMLEGWGYRSLFEDGSDASGRTALAARIAGYAPSIVWLAVGTNDYGLSNGLWSAADFQTAYADLLDKLHAALPSAAIYAQSPVDRLVESANADFGNTLGDYRTAISNACSGRAWATFVDGTAFISTAELDPDGIHPNTTGHNLYYLAVKSVLGL